MEHGPAIIQILLIIAAAPLFGGLITKIKNIVRLRRGAPVLQPYWNFFKLLGKSDDVISQHASWLFKAAPYVVISSSAAALLLVPLFGGFAAAGGMGDIVAVLFILALGRFFMALAGMDAASAFGGMGSSREMFISSLAETAALVSFFALALNSGSTSFAAIAGDGVFRASSFTAGFALFLVAIAETSRIPVDNQETHLELTMVHEAMALEYSGRSLAIIEYASHIRQLVWFSLIAGIIFPLPPPSGCGAALAAASAAVFALKLLALAVIMAFTEISLAKMRLFRVADLLMFAFVAALASAVLAAGGY